MYLAFRGRTYKLEVEYLIPGICITLYVNSLQNLSFFFFLKFLQDVLQQS